MSDEQFRQMCNVYGFAPSRALREMMDAVAGQAVISEREACAKVCDEIEPSARHEGGWLAGWSDGAEDCAAEIRKRGRQ